MKIKAQLIHSNQYDALTVLKNEPPTESWLHSWCNWMKSKCPVEKHDSIDLIFNLAIHGLGDREDGREVAQLEIASILESMAKQIRANCSCAGPAETAQGQTQGQSRG